MAKGISNCLDDENLRRKILSKSHAIHNKFRFCVHDDRREEVWKPVHDTVADDIAHETAKDGHVSPEAPIWSHWLWHLWNGYHDHDQYNVDSATSFVLTINYNAGHDGVDIGDGDDYAVDGETAFVYMCHILCVFD